MKKYCERFGAALAGAALAMFLVGGALAGEKKPSEATVGFITSLTGTFAGVAETQRRAFIYAVEHVNAQGGLTMPWGKVKLKTIVADDEAKLDIGVQRFRDIVQNGAFAVTGSIWNPMTTAVNEEAKIDPVVYIAGSIPAIDIFKKGVPAPSTFSASFTPWTLGYLCGQSVLKELGKKKIYFLERSDSWGQAIKKGLELACKDFGGQIVGVSQTPLGTSEFSSIINLVLQSDADAFITSMFGGDAIACIKQSYDMGLTRKAIILNPSITNVVAAGLPPAALENLYGVAYFYWDMTGTKNAEVARRVKEFSDGYMKRWNEAPDSMSGCIYVALEAIFRNAEKAGSLDPLKIAEAFMQGSVETMKGTTRFREDHQTIMEQACFLVRGKGASERKGEYDFFEVITPFGGEGILPPLAEMGY